MAFEKISKGHPGRLARNDAVTLRVSGAKSAIFALSENIFSRLGSPDFVDISVGTGKDAGLVAIEAANGGYNYKVLATGRQHRIVVPASKIGIPADKRPTTELPFKVKGGNLIVNLRSITSPLSVAAE